MNTNFKIFWSMVALASVSFVFSVDFSIAIGTHGSILKFTKEFFLYFFAIGGYVPEQSLSHFWLNLLRLDLLALALFSIFERPTVFYSN